MSVNKKAKYQDIDGILLVDKPQEASSNHVLQQVRRGFNARKAGHTGTLDPFASGLLVCCFGHATKVCGLLLDADKTYHARLALGSATDTADCEGQICAEATIPVLSESGIREVLASFIGEREQVPPMYSALKVNGKRLYELARAGVEVERQPRRIVIHELELLSWSAQHIDFAVRCSKGTYVRTLGEEIAVALGTIGHLSALRRVALGPFHVDNAATPEGLEKQEWPSSALLGSDRALIHWPACALDTTQSEDFLHGREVQQVLLSPAETVGLQALKPIENSASGSADHEILTLAATGDVENVRVYGAKGRFLGCGHWCVGGALRPKRLFVAANKG